MLRFLLFIFFFLGSFQINAQWMPAPGTPQEKPVYIVGGTIHIGNGEVIENGVVAFDKGVITLVSEDANMKIDTEKNKLINAKGKHIYPGFISPNSLIGLVEINAVRPTRDYREVGRYKPHVRSIIAYNTDSWVTPTVRANGVLLAQIKPAGGTIPGTSSVIQLDAWNYEDALVKEDDALYLSWPNVMSRGGWWANPGSVKKNDKYNERIESLHAFFKESKSYCLSDAGGETNLKLEAMCDCFSKTKKVFVAASQAKAIVDAIEFMKQYDVEMVLVGGADSWMVTEVLVENDIPVVLSQTHRLPFRPEDDIDLPFKLPVLLRDAGIDFCMSAENFFGEQRNLPFTIGKSIAYGLTKEEALMAITSSTAKILGIDDRVGTLEQGKDATLIISEGDALNVTGNNVENAFIEGRTVLLEDKQKELYRKFMTKYGKETK